MARRQSPPTGTSAKPRRASTELAPVAGTALAPIPTPAQQMMTLESGRGNLEHLATLRLWHDKNSMDGDLPIFANVKIGPIAIDGGG